MSEEEEISESANCSGDWLNEQDEATQRFFKRYDTSTLHEWTKEDLLKLVYEMSDRINTHLDAFDELFERGDFCICKRCQSLVRYGGMRCCFPPCVTCGQENLFGGTKCLSCRHDV